MKSRSWLARPPSWPTKRAWVELRGNLAGISYTWILSSWIASRSLCIRVFGTSAKSCDLPASLPPQPLNTADFLLTSDNASDRSPRSLSSASSSQPDGSRLAVRPSVLQFRKQATPPPPLLLYQKLHFLPWHRGRRFQARLWTTRTGVALYTRISHTHFVHAGDPLQDSCLGI